MVKDFSRTVGHLGLKRTRVRALGGEQAIIAHPELLRNTAYKYRRMCTRRIVFTLRNSPSTPRFLKH
ncbi:hypothetical protein JN27_08445 [Massilia sp. BSC265]|nr:hypothetical protein [Massilia sp. BSC265]KFI07601.1 hypothetical protein JN27_08445 [Massilia sp. BSC265]